MKEENNYIIHVDKPGTFAENLNQQKAIQGGEVLSLSVTGNLNRNDIMSIFHEVIMPQIDEDYYPLEFLDLSTANLDTNAVECIGGPNFGSKEYGFLTECEHLTEVRLPLGIKTLWNGFFRNCSALEKITIPDTVTFIGSYCICSCPKLKAIQIPSHIEQIRDGFLEFCDSIEAIELSPENKRFVLCDDVLYTSDMKTLVRYPIYKKSEKYTIPESVIEIMGGAFEGNPFIQQITLPPHLKILVPNAFIRCTNLQSLKIEEGNPIFFTDQGLLYKKEQIYPQWSTFDLQVETKKLRIPKYKIRLMVFPKGHPATDIVSHDLDLDEVDAGFCYNRNIRKAEVNCVDIPKYFFYACSNLEELRLSFPVESMHVSSIQGCTSLKKISLKNQEHVVNISKKFTSENPFEGIDLNHCILEVPERLIEEYKKSEWNRFANIVPKPKREFGLML